MLFIISSIIACVLILVGMLLALCPGKPEAFRDENGRLLEGSISEKVFVHINGLEQGMFIKSKNIDNPVLLFVHGGPGMPEYWLTQRYPTGLEDYFTAPPTMTVPLPASYDALRDKYMHGVGIGTIRDMDSVITGIFLPSWRFREYTLREKVNLWRGKFFSRSHSFGLWDQMLATDLTQQVIELGVPVYFFHGKYDYTCAYPLAKDYFEKLEAPLKGFYTFEQSAHSPIFEEPAKMIEILRKDVLSGTNDLADTK